MTAFPHLATRVFNQPLAIEPGKLDAVMNVLGPRLDLKGFQAQDPFGFDDDDHLDSQAEDVALVPILGTLVHRAMGAAPPSMLISYGEIIKLVQSAADSPSIKSIVLDIDSPGGEVNGMFEAVEAIRTARTAKPVYAIVDEMAASAAFALASAADKIIIPQTGTVGSVGVLALHVDQSAKNKQDGLNHTFITSGSQKLDGNPHEPLGNDAQSRISAEVGRVAGLLFDTVARNRGLSRDAVARQDAALFHGQQAVTAGMADSLESPRDALDRILREPARTGAQAAARPKKSWAQAKAEDQFKLRNRPAETDTRTSAKAAEDQWKQVLARREIDKSHQ